MPPLTQSINDAGPDRGFYEAMHAGLLELERIGCRTNRRQETVRKAVSGDLVVASTAKDLFDHKNQMAQEFFGEVPAGVNFVVIPPKQTADVVFNRIHEFRKIYPLSAGGGQLLFTHNWVAEWFHYRLLDAKRALEGFQLFGSIHHAVAYPPRKEGE